MTRWFTYLVILFALPAHAADVCEIRPDLCGGSAHARKKKVLKKTKVGDLEQKKKKPCRESLNLDEEDPCRSPQSEETAAATTFTPPRTKMNFDAYMKNNSTHPALGRQPASVNQTAFPTNIRRAPPAPDLSAPAPSLPSPSTSSSSAGETAAPASTLDPAPSTGGL